MLPFIAEIQLSVGETEQVMKAGNKEYVLYPPCPHRPMRDVFQQTFLFF